MKRNAILLVLLIILTSSILSTRFSGVANGSTTSVETLDYQKMWGDMYDSTGGVVTTSPVYTDGVRLNDGISKFGWAIYWFYLPTGVYTTLDVGVYGRDTTLWGDGADVYVRNWASSTWDYVGTTGKSEGINIFTVNPTNHTSPLTYSYVIRVFAGPDDRYDLWYVDTEYNWVAEADTVLDFSFEPNPVYPGVTVELQGTLTNEYGHPMYWADVDVEYSVNDGLTWSSLWTLPTYPLGKFSTSFPAPGVGEYLVRVRYDGSAIYHPSSHIETLVVQEPWGDYHFVISPWIDELHLKISGNVIYGISDAITYHNQPVLGYIEGSTFCLFIDFTKKDNGDPIGRELLMLVGSVSTLSGNVYRTTDGTSWAGPAAFSLVSASITPTITEPAFPSTFPTEPESWPPTYHFQLSPWVDIVHLGLDGQVLHGQCDAITYSDQPVLGYVSGDFFIFALDYTKNDDGSPIPFELSITQGSVSAMSGNMYRTVDGKSVVGPEAITLVPTSP